MCADPPSGNNPLQWVGETELSRLARYRQLRRRAHTLREYFADAEAMNRVMVSGRYLKLSATLARVFEQIEREFPAQRPRDQE
jgi:hypothetical protein